MHTVKGIISRNSMPKKFPKEKGYFRGQSSIPNPFTPPLQHPFVSTDTLGRLDSENTINF